MQLSTAQLNDIVQSDFPSMKPTNIKGADHILLAKFRQERYHTSKKQTDITKVT